MTEHDETHNADSEEIVEIPAADLQKLLRGHDALAQMWLDERERGNRTVAGLIHETQRRLIKLASSKKPGWEWPEGPSSLAERIKASEEGRQLTQESYNEALDLVMLLSDAIELLGAGAERADTSENDA